MRSSGWQGSLLQMAAIVLESPYSDRSYRMYEGVASWGPRKLTLKCRMKYGELTEERWKQMGQGQGEVGPRCDLN